METSDTRESQNKAIKKWLESGKSISQKTADKIFNCWRLSARIYDLKNKFGMNIKTEMVTYGRKKYARYFLVIDKPLNS